VSAAKTNIFDGELTVDFERVMPEAHFDFTNGATGLTASFNSPTQKAMGIPLRNVSYTTPKGALTPSRPRLSKKRLASATEM
jgi:hypothetical protein